MKASLLFICVLWIALDISLGNSYRFHGPRTKSLNRTPVGRYQNKSLDRGFPESSRRLPSKLHMTDDNPSDMEDSDSGSSLPQVPALSASFAKDVLLSELQSKSSSSMSQIEINEYVLALEKENPTANPATSKLINGVWELVVSGFGTPGLAAYQALKLVPSRFLDLQDVTLTISQVSPRVQTTTCLKSGPFQLDICVNTDIEAVSGSRLKETYTSGKVGSIDIPLSSIDTLNRELIITYVDEDILIARDCFGSPEVLLRKEGNPPKTGEYDIPASDSGVGSTSSGDEAPGASA